MTGPIIDSGAWGRPVPETIPGEIRDVRAGDKAAIDHFYRRYATPVFCYFRACGADRETAKDLTQEVMAKLLCDQPLADFDTAKLETADPEAADLDIAESGEAGADTVDLGTADADTSVTDTAGLETAKPKPVFRPYLKRALANKYVDDMRRAGAGIRKPPGGVASLDKILDEVGENWVPGDDETPEEAFDRQYSHVLLDTVINRVQRDCARSPFAIHFKTFVERYFLDPPRTFPQIAADYSMTEDQARNKTNTVLNRLGRALRAELRAKGMTEAEIDEEIRELIQAFRLRGRRRSPG